MSLVAGIGNEKYIVEDNRSNMDETHKEHWMKEKCGKIYYSDITRASWLIQSAAIRLIVQ